MPKCAECGFVAFRHHDTRDLVEVDRPCREEGWSPGSKYGLPVCSVGACPKIVVGDESTLEALRAERDCDSFTPWLPTFSPKEHRQMLIENKVFEWEKERYAREEAARREEREYRDRKESERIHKDRVWYVVSGVGAFILVSLFNYIFGNRP